MAIYQCRDCDREEYIPRRYRLHFGRECRCPRCGTLRVIRLKEPDKIDPMITGFLNLLERLAGGRIHHCRYCRIQFYDRRPLASELAHNTSAGKSVEYRPAAASPVPEVTTPQDTASSGA